MLKEDFEIKYCKDSDISLEDYHKYFITLPCNCKDEGCIGWACVCNNEISIKSHMDMYY